MDTLSVGAAGNWTGGSGNAFVSGTFDAQGGSIVTAPADLQVGGNFTVAGAFTNNLGNVSLFASVIAYICFDLAVGVVGATKGGLFLHRERLIGLPKFVAKISQT